MEMVDRIVQYMDAGKLPLSVFLHLSKAFDAIDHTILLPNLQDYGLSCTPLRWFVSYLHDRQQFVHFNGILSGVQHVMIGTPQGSILAPLYSIIYMNDIHVACNKFNAILYADNTNLISPQCFSMQNPTVWCRYILFIKSHQWRTEWHSRMVEYQQSIIKCR